MVDEPEMNPDKIKFQAMPGDIQERYKLKVTKDEYNEVVNKGLYKTGGMRHLLSTEMRVLDRDINISVKQFWNSQNSTQDTIL